MILRKPKKDVGVGKAEGQGKFVELAVVIVTWC